MNNSRRGGRGSKRIASCTGSANRASPRGSHSKRASALSPPPPPSSSTTSSSAAPAAPAARAGGGPKSAEAALVKAWRTSVGEFLFKGRDDAAAYFVRPLTESERWLRDDLGAWATEMRAKLNKKKQLQLRQALTKRRLSAEGDDDALRARLLAAIVDRRRATCAQEIVKEKAQPQYLHRLAAARQAAGAKAQVFRDIDSARKASARAYGSVTEAVSQLTDRMEELRGHVRALRESSARQFELARATAPKIIRPGDHVSDKVEKLFAASAADALSADAAEAELLKLTRTRADRLAACAAALRKRELDAEAVAAAQTLQDFRAGTDDDVRAILARANNPRFFESAAVQTAACQAMWYLAAPSAARAAAVQATRDRLVAHGALQTLARALRTFGDNQALLDPWALGTLAYLTETPHATRAARRGGTAAVAAGPHTDARLKPKYVAIQALAVNDGVLAALLGLLHRPAVLQSEETVGMVCWALRAVVGNAAANLRIAHDEGVVAAVRAALKQHPETLRHRRQPNHWRYVHAAPLIDAVERSSYAESARQAAALQRQKPKSLRRPQGVHSR